MAAGADSKRLTAENFDYSELKLRFLNLKPTRIPTEPQKFIDPMHKL